MGFVEYAIDREKRRTFLRCAGDIDGPAVLARLREFWTQFPEVAGYDCLTDMQLYTGDMSFADIRAIATAWYEFSKQSDVGAYSAVVSQDRFAEIFMKLVMLVFPSRRFSLFRSIEAAEQWLDRHA